MSPYLPISLLALVSATTSAALADRPAWHSAFDGYQAFTDEKPVPWPQANQTVRQVGGWRAYAREAAQPASAPASTTRPNPGTANAHEAHHKP